MATVDPVRGETAANPAAGPAHVAVVSFLASRVVPSGGYWVALAGGIALARVGERRGAREGYGASIAAMLETVAIIGPLRFAIPLTQAITAPLLGHLEARGMAVGWQMAVCTIMRLLQNTLQTAFFIFVLAGGIDAVTGTYDRFAGFVGLDVDDTGTLMLTAIGLVGWAVFASVVQVLVYRRGLVRWDKLEENSVTAAPVAIQAAAIVLADAPPGTSRFDPRLLALVAVALVVALLASIAWTTLVAVAVFLALAWVVSRPDPRPLRAGLAFTALLGGTVLLLALVGGLGIEVALQRAVRAALLVMTATWLRAAARAEGLRFVFHRTLQRLRLIPSVPQAREVLDALTSEARLAASGRAFARALDDVPHRPMPFVDAVIGWVVRESAAHGARQV